MSRLRGLGFGWLWLAWLAILQLQTVAAMKGEFEKTNFFNKNQVTRSCDTERTVN